MGDRTHGIDPKRLSEYAQDIKEIVAMGVEVAVVIGGGNIFRGVAAASNGMDRVQGDYMGMLATCINGMALQSALEDAKVPTRLQTAIKIEAIAWGGIVVDPFEIEFWHAPSTTREAELVTISFGKFSFA